jgi:hypothetical protein
MSTEGGPWLPINFLRLFGFSSDWQLQEKTLDATCRTILIGTFGRDAGGGPGDPRIARFDLKSRVSPGGSRFTRWLFQCGEPPNLAQELFRRSAPGSTFGSIPLAISIRIPTMRRRKPSGGSVCWRAKPPERQGTFADRPSGSARPACNLPALQLPRIQTPAHA